MEKIIKIEVSSNKEPKIAGGNELPCGKTREDVETIVDMSLEQFTDATDRRRLAEIGSYELSWLVSLRLESPQNYLVEYRFKGQKGEVLLKRIYPLNYLEQVRRGDVCKFPERAGRIV